MTATIATQALNPPTNRTKVNMTDNALFPWTYEFEVEINYSNSPPGDLSTTFIARSIGRDDADSEAKIAAEMWLRNIHKTCEDSNELMLKLHGKRANLALPDMDCHVRSGDVTWIDNGKLQKSTHRFIGVVRLPLVKEIDPEFQRLLDEEEAIERGETPYEVSDERITIHEGDTP